MLLRFQFSNFRSFRDSQELSLVASSLHGTTYSTAELPGLKEKALTACALYGANASGKTTVFNALDFMDTAVREPHRNREPNKGVPLEPFEANPASAPSEFAVHFVRNGIR